MKRNLFFIAALCIIVITAAAGRQNDSRIYNYDVQHYVLSIKFDIVKQSFIGSVKIRAILLQPISLFVVSASNETLTIDSVVYKNKQIRFDHTNDHLVCNLAEIVEARSEIELTVYYKGISKFHGQYEGGGVTISISKGLGRIATSSQPNYARMWWPCKDTPSDKATAAINVTVPSNLTAVSNGVLLSSERSVNTTTYRWATQYPISTYLVAIAAAKYKHYTEQYIGLNGQKMKIIYYVFPEDFEKAKKDFENVKDMLRYFATTLCEYPFINEKFGFVEVSGNMTMENQTICSIDERLLTGDKQFESTILHEIAHQWWGNLITPTNWQHTWLNEGFATYAEALYIEHTKGQRAYQNYMNQMMAVKQGHYAGSVLGRSDTLFWDSFAPRVYYKGAIVLHMLRGVVGDSAFFTILKNYSNNPRLRYGNTQTEDFILECEKVTQRSMKWFFDQWVYAYTESIDRPEYEYSWNVSSMSSDHSILLAIEQKTASQQLYRMPMKVHVTTSESEHIFSIVDSLQFQQYRFTVPEKPRSVEIDKDNWIFKILTRKGSY
jgi:aminopeptidase N